MENLIKEIIAPQNDLEMTIVCDPEFVEGAMYGKPRRGHPEGKVVYHIREVLDNIDRFEYGDEDLEGCYDKLRLIAIIHDTFKYKVDRTKPKTGENHHAMIARRFAEKYIEDEAILDIIELHDEAYNAWRLGSRKGKWDRAEARFDKLMERLGTPENTDLFTMFFKCDSYTGDKDTTSVDWYCEQLIQTNNHI